MRAGSLDRAVTLQRRTLSTDDAGAPVETWADLATAVPAQVRPLRARERVAAPSGLEQRGGTVRIATAEIVVTIRWRVGLGPVDRVLHDGRVWDVTGIAELGRRGGIEILAQARAE
jgi:head-tail adaptor